MHDDFFLVFSRTQHSLARTWRGGDSSRPINNRKSGSPSQRECAIGETIIENPFSENARLSHGKPTQEARIDRPLDPGVRVTVKLDKVNHVFVRMYDSVSLKHTTQEDRIQIFGGPLETVK